MQAASKDKVLQSLNGITFKLNLNCFFLVFFKEPAAKLGAEYICICL